MSQDNKIVLSKLLQTSRDDSERKTHIYMQTKCTPEAIELLMTDSYSNKSYKARVSNDEIRETAGELDLLYDDCYTQIYTALTTNLAPGFISEINDHKRTYKLIKQHNCCVDYIVAKLREVSNNHEMLENAIDFIALESQDACAKVNAGLFEEKERKMLKKFAMLLNAKKLKIEELQRKLAQLQSAEDANGSTDEELSAVTVTPECSTAGTSTKRSSSNSRNNSKKSKCVIESNNEDTNDEAADYDAMTQPMSL